MAVGHRGVDQAETGGVPAGHTRKAYTNASANYESTHSGNDVRPSYGSRSLYGYARTATHERLRTNAYARSRLSWACPRYGSLYYAHKRPRIARTVTHKKVTHERLRTISAIYGCGQDTSQVEGPTRFEADNAAESRRCPAEELSTRRPASMGAAWSPVTRGLPRSSSRPTRPSLPCGAGSARMDMFLGVTGHGRARTATVGGQSSPSGP